MYCNHIHNHLCKHINRMILINIIVRDKYYIYYVTLQNTRVAHYRHSIVSHPRSVNKVKKCQTDENGFPLLNIIMQYDIIRYILKIKRLHTRCLLLCFLYKKLYKCPVCSFFKIHHRISAFKKMIYL